MKYFFLLLSLLLFSACTFTDKALKEECEKGIGEACNKLGKNAETPSSAEAFLKRACDLDNTNGCVNYAELVKTENPTAAKTALHHACDRGNTNACAKLAEFLQNSMQK